MPPLVSIVITALNEEKNIGRVLDSLRKGTYKNYEVIIVDGGSMDKTKDVAKSKGARVIKETGNKGCANAKNQGFAAAKGKIAIQVDADIEGVNAKFIENVVRRFSQKGVIAVAPRKEKLLSTFWEKALYESRRVVHFIFNALRGRLETISKKEESWFPNAILRKTFFELGGYPNVGSEDRLFAAKFNAYCAKNGVRCAYEPNSVIYTHEPRTFREILKQYEWYSRVTIPYVRASGDKREVLLYLISLLQPIALASFLLVPYHTVFAFFAGLYAVKAGFIALYAVVYRSPHVLATPLLDFVGGVWKYYGLLRLLKMELTKSDRINSRAD